MAKIARNAGSTRAGRWLSEIGIDVVLRTAEPCFKGGHKGIFADLHQAGGARAFLVDDWRAAGDDGLLGYAVEIAGSALNVGAGLVELFPADFS